VNRGRDDAITEQLSCRSDVLEQQRGDCLGSEGL
jgi:hypothetical protein